MHTFERYLRGRVAEVRQAVFAMGIPIGILIVVLGTLAARRAVGGYERGIEEANRTLEARVAERTAELEHALRDLRAAQDSLVRNKKMVLLGQLVGSLAHELNNPLTAVIGLSSLMLQTERDPGRRERLEAIQGAGTRCSTLIRTFLDYARNQPPRAARQDINAIVRNAATIIEGKFRDSRVRLVLDLRRDIPPSRWTQCRWNRSSST